jgi:hypothetical protein
MMSGEERRIMDGKKLTADEQQKLLGLLHQTRDSRQYRRVLAVLEYSRGKTAAKVAELLEVSRQSVYNWIENFWHMRDVQTLIDAPGLDVHAAGAKTQRPYCRFC